MQEVRPYNQNYFLITTMTTKDPSELAYFLSTPKEISRSDIRAMKRLMIRLETKKFNTDDKELLSRMSARFSVICAMMDYKDGYSLVD